MSSMPSNEIIPKKFSPFYKFRLRNEVGFKIAAELLFSLLFFCLPMAFAQPEQSPAAHPQKLTLTEAGMCEAVVNLTPLKQRVSLAWVWC
jgi:hypothetical protein